MTYIRRGFTEAGYNWKTIKRFIFLLPKLAMLFTAIGEPGLDGLLTRSGQ